MNFSNRLTGLLYISSSPVLQFLLVLFVQHQFQTSTFQSFLFRQQTPSGNSRSVWDCKGRNLFSIVKLFFKNFFSFYFQQIKSTSLYLFPCFSSSEAGCKSTKIIRPNKYLITIIYTHTLTCYSSIRKNHTTMQTFLNRKCLTLFTCLAGLYTFVIQLV